MKFSQLPIGQQFEYLGNSYTKHGPLSASDSNGHNKLIPRSADVTVSGNTITAKQSEPDKNISYAKLLTAFEEFYNVCMECVSDNNVAQDKLEKARGDFLRRLNK